MDRDIHLTGIQSDINKMTVCTSSTCITDEDRYKVECGECKRFVHYRCTQLPLYQIQLFLTKGYRIFVCVNCVDIPKYLSDIVPEVGADETHSKFIAELAIANAEIKQIGEDYEQEKINTSKLSTKLNSLHAEMVRQT